MLLAYAYYATTFSRCTAHVVHDSPAVLPRAGPQASRRVVQPWYHAAFPPSTVARKLQAGTFTTRLPTPAM
eukprot:3788160-Pyramimonas_sp.AAC.1